MAASPLLPKGYVIACAIGTVIQEMSHVSDFRMIWKRLIDMQCLDSNFKIITLSDLECDYINARACCSKLNKWVIPEMVGQCLSMMLMLVSMHWFIFVLNMPVAAWNIYRYVKIPMGNMGVFDPTEIHNRGLLKSYMKEAMIKLGYHLLCFFIYLYSLILALIND
uniref:Cornichon family member 4 n=1 Tax=Fundulus heteroclitus TaxID=8078 RepID=A0A3Q2NUA8_FUNHE